MKIEPLNEHILLRPVEAETKTKGGIILPDAAREAPPEGIVEALPPGGAQSIAIGDRVLFKRGAGEELDLEGQKLRLLPVADLIARYAQADAIPA